MTARRSPRKQATPAVLPVPRVRTIRSDEIAESTQSPENSAMRPRRNRKPKFVF